MNDWDIPSIDAYERAKATGRAAWRPLNAYQLLEIGDWAERQSDRDVEGIVWRLLATIRVLAPGLAP